MEFSAYRIPNASATATATSAVQEKLYIQIRGLPRPEAADRPGIHFIAVLDRSGSMGSAGRLTNCLDSMRFLTRFLTARDSLSLITFSGSADIVMKAITMDRVGAELLENHLRIEAGGGTSISAAIECIQECVVAADPALKTGVLFLTDGQANEGIVAPHALQQMLRAKLAAHPNVTVSTIGYGCDHNTELLQVIAEQNSGSYNVVNDRENVASVFGLLLGSLMSCVGSNVRINAPIETTVRPRHLRTADALDGTDVYAGDIYADTETAVLLTTRPGLSELTVRGYNVIEGADVRVAVPIKEAPAPIWLQVKVFELRQDVSELLGELASSSYSAATSEAARQSQMSKIAALRARCTDETIATNPVIRMLDQQLAESLEVLESNRVNNETRTLFAQNSAYTGMGRGLRATVSAAVSISQDPVNGYPEHDPFSSPTMRQVSGAVHALSQAHSHGHSQAHSHGHSQAHSHGHSHVPHARMQRQVARYLTEDEIQEAELLRAILTSGSPSPTPATPAPAAASVMLTSPPPINRLQYATNLFSREASPTLTAILPPPTSPMLRQIAAPSRQTSNISGDDFQLPPVSRMVFNSPLLGPNAVMPETLPAITLGAQLYRMSPIAMSDDYV
jgi:Mg-chelatase subunit ChlD